MTDKPQTSLIEGHAQLQERAQPLLKVIHVANKDLPLAQLKVDNWAKGQNANRRDLVKAKSRVEDLIDKRDSGIEQLEILIAPDAKTSCRVLCDRLRRSLPRELRDSIYEYVDTPTTVIVDSNYFDHPQQPRDINVDAHYWDADYVGEGVQREMIESWYRNTLFHFSSGHDLAPRFLDHDRWQMCIKPRNYIRKSIFEIVVTDLNYYERVYD